MTRYRIAAFDAATGALITTFNAGTNSQVRAIAATNTTVYVGGIFTQAGSAARTRLAAFNAVERRAAALGPDGRRRLGQRPDGLPGRHVVDHRRQLPVVQRRHRGTRTGSPASTPSPAPCSRSPRRRGSATAARPARSSGCRATPTTCTASATRSAAAGGTLEGVFAADWDTGELTWVADCHGDTYAVWPQGDVVYAASHHHYCGNIRANPQLDEWEFYRAGAFTKAATQLAGREHLGYTNFEGLPAPTKLNWYPDLDTGTFTGQNQGPWAVTGDSRYIVMGGEFLNVNFRRQQGLVRFAVRDIAPNDQGPRFSAADFTPNLRPVGTGAVRVSWPANADFDNELLHVPA